MEKNWGDTPSATLMNDIRLGESPPLPFYYIKNPQKVKRMKSGKIDPLCRFFKNLLACTNLVWFLTW